MAATLAMLGLGATLALFASMASAAPPWVTTEPATTITESDATLNGMVGDTDASATAFWASTSTFTPVAGPSPVLPPGVYSSGALDAVASSTGFSAQLSSLDIPEDIVVEDDTTYYYTAWVQVEGTWYPGEVLNFTTDEEEATSTAPVISGISVTDIGTSSATISWTTDGAATSSVHYGTTASYGSSTEMTTTASTSHMVTLTDLMPDTTYHFSIHATNEEGTTMSVDQTFSTDEEDEPATTTPLTVVSITPVNTSATANGTYESGWSWVMRLTVPMDEDAFRMSFTDWTGDEGTFESDNNMRIYSPQSSNANSTSTALSTPEGGGYTDWMYLNGDANLLMAGRQIDVTIEVRIPTGTAPGSYSTDFSGNSTMQSATSTTP